MGCLVAAAAHSAGSSCGQAHDTPGCLHVPADDSPAAPHRVRLLTAQASVGIVLGKRGATVSQLRQETGASIKVLPTEPVPPAFGGSIGGDDCDTGACLAGTGWKMGPHIGAALAVQGCTGQPFGLLLCACKLLCLPAGCTAPLDCQTAHSALHLAGSPPAPAEMGSISSGMSTGGRSSMCGSEEVIQIEGNVQQCVAALRGVATLLRGWQIRRVMTSQQGAMAMQQGGYPGFAQPMPMAQQVPMSPVSTSGAPMSPTSPGVQLMPADSRFWGGS